MKFLHTSDWHLGRQFHQVSLLDDQSAVLAQLIDFLRDNPVDAVIVIGDIMIGRFHPRRRLIYWMKWSA